MLPERFTELQLYGRIAGLSYIGDPRMNSFLPGENPNKASNIVREQLLSSRQLYAPLIDSLPTVDFNDSYPPHDIGWEKENGIHDSGSLPVLSNIVRLEFAARHGSCEAREHDPVPTLRVQEEVLLLV
jgi:translocator assembly and maintenance protein 41